VSNTTTARKTRPAPGSVRYDGLAPVVRVERLASGRLVIETPYSPELAPAMRRLSARRARLVAPGQDRPEGHGELGRLADGRTAVHVSKDGSRGAAGDFAWTVAAVREDDLRDLLTRLWPAPSAVYGRLGLFKGLSRRVSVAVAADGRLAVTAPYTDEQPERGLGRKWDPASRRWLVPAHRAEELAAALTRLHGTEAGNAAAEAARAAAQAEQRAAEHAARAAAKARRDALADAAPNDGGTPPLPPKLRRAFRTRRDGWCKRCENHVPAGTGTWDGCGPDSGGHEFAGHGWCDGDGQCGGTVVCGDCHWRASYGLPDDTDPQTWVRLGLTVERVRACVAAGLSPTEYRHDLRDQALSVMGALVAPGQ
jgi:hypothetical protein